jgi:signal-transduction protein with cAMP-binding, CBS, and nucleotidyltransferase domain
MKVADLSARPAVTIQPSSTVAQTAALMSRVGVGSVVVVDGDQLVGIVTDRDLVVRSLAKHLPADARIDSVMSMNVIAVDRHADIRDAIALFHHHAVRRMPVVDGDQVVGLISLDDMMVALSKVYADVTHGLTAQLVFPHGNDEADVPAIV